MLLLYSLFFSIITAYYCLSFFLFLGYSSLKNFYYIFYVLFYSLIIAISLKFLYNLIYERLNLEKTTISLVAFFFNNILLMLFMFNIILIYSNAYKNPIMLNEISLVTKYRYLFISIICIIFFLILCLHKITGKTHININYIKYPFLKEEFRILLNAINYNAIGSFFSFILDNLYANIYFRFLYCFCYFFIFVFFRFLILYHFIIFCFFQGDLRNVFYLLPLSLIIWVFSFFDYFLNYFLIGNVNYIKELLLLNQKETNINKNIIFKAELTEYALKKGYTTIDIPQLTTTYLKLLQINLILEKYKKLIVIPNVLFIITYISTYIYLSYIFFITETPSDIDSFILTLPFVTFFKTKLLGVPKTFNPIKNAFHTTKPLNSPRDARYVPEPLMNTLKVTTSKAYSPGHYIIGELLPDGLSYRIDGSLTKGNESSNHPMILLSPNKLVDGTYSSTGQKYIPFPQPIVMPATMLNHTLKGSTLFLEAPQIKNLIDAIHNLMGRN